MQVSSSLPVMSSLLLQNPLRFVGLKIFEIAQKVIEVFSSIIDYFKHMANNLSEPVVKEISKADPEVLALGTSTLKSMYDGTFETPKDVQHSKALMAAVMQWLMVQAEKKGQGFEEGSFVLEDPENRIAKSMIELGATYERISSHLPKRSSATHYGLDVDGMMKGTLTGKNTVLIIPFENRILLKPEEYGTKTFVHFIRHSISYLAALKGRFGVLSPENEAKMRNERVPWEILRAFGALPGITQEQCQKARIDGIAYMIQEVKQIQTKRPVEQLQAFLDSLKGLDHLEIRTGFEVILTKNELFSS